MAINGEKRQLGFLGETKAAAYLKKLGYEILKRNFRCPFGEVDIIAQKGDVTAFIEVKTRSNNNYGAPNEAVDNKRKQRYKNCVRFYYAHREIDCTVRFDVIEVTKDGINHIENAFY
ncbi:MAG: YraN family protein [Clostridia bacterium]|nr:YraN family protein [Clostridia bacterium]